MNFLSIKTSTYKSSILHLVGIFFMLIMLVMPQVARAEFSLVPCNPTFSGGANSSGSTNTGSASGGNLTGECGWEQLVALGQNIINYSVYLMTILSVIGIAYAGFLYITAQGNSSQISKAHGIFIKIIWGIIFVLCAWLIVNTILAGLGYGQNGFQSFLKSGSGATNDD